LRHILLNVNVNDAGGANISECCKVAIWHFNKYIGFCI
jgi:hypothetical protein